jgi:hypothetical protein
MHDLPRVSIETVHSAAASTDDDPEFINSTLEKMKTENPVLFQCLRVMLDSDKHDEFKTGYLTGSINFYLLLRSQAQSDILEKIWG